MRRSLDEILAEERARGEPMTWCQLCRTWHYDACTFETMSEGDDREREIEKKMLTLQSG